MYIIYGALCKILKSTENACKILKNGNIYRRAAWRHCNNGQKFNASFCMQTMKKTIRVGVASVVSPSDVVFGPTARMVTLVPTTTPAYPAGCSQTANMEISAILYTLSASLMQGETFITSRVPIRKKEFGSRYDEIMMKPMM